MSTIQECEENARYCRQTGNIEGEATWLGALAARYRDSYNGSKALEYFNQSLRLWERAGNNRAVANTYSAISLTYADVLHDLTRAIEYARRAVSQAVDETNRSIYQNELDNLLRKQKGG
jgi:hypothetical protein